MPRPSAPCPRPFALLAVAVLAVVAPRIVRPAETDPLREYVAAKDESFGWRLHATHDLGSRGSAAVLRLTSQTWRGMEWTHWLAIARPAAIRHPEHALLVVGGGSRRSGAPDASFKEARLLTRLAVATGTVVVHLGQVPNQPILGDRYEDAIISLTFEKFLRTGDPTWPCLLPMVKSAVRAMDAVQGFSRERRLSEPKRFVVTGASKRGWTTWLTAAVDDRVVAIAPRVIDTLNMPAQMRLQRLSFGGYSERIHDYTERGLPDRLAEPGARKLLDIVDPYSYRERFTMPKLIQLGTNDRYWPVDALKLYLGDLPGESLIHYVPNAGHGLGAGAAEALAAFYACVVEGRPRPRFRWETRRSGDGATTTIVAQDAPRRVELFRASAATRDFRDSRWSGREIPAAGEGRYQLRVEAPASGYAAFFGRLTYESPLGGAWTLATNVEVLGDRPGELPSPSRPSSAGGGGARTTDRK